MTSAADFCLQINPYMMLVGHTARVVCLSDGLLHTNHKYLVSAALNGWVTPRRTTTTNTWSRPHWTGELTPSAHQPQIPGLCRTEWVSYPPLHTNHKYLVSAALNGWVTPRPLPIPTTNTWSRPRWMGELSPAAHQPQIPGLCRTEWVSYPPLHTNHKYLVSATLNGWVIPLLIPTTNTWSLPHWTGEL